MDGRPVYLIGGRSHRGGILAALMEYEAARTREARLEAQVEEQKLPEPDVAAQTSALEKALRDEQVRSKRHYAVTGTYAEVHRNGKVAIVKRRTINAPVRAADELPRGGGKKEMARRARQAAAAAAKATQVTETGEQSGNAAGQSE